MTEAGKMSEELLAIRDGVRLRAHLFSMEAKQAWQKWETSLVQLEQRLERDAGQAAAVLRESAQDWVRGVRDFARAHAGLEAPARLVMTSPVATCGPHESVNRAAQLFWDTGCGSLPVVEEDGALLGMLTDRDICIAAYTQGRRLEDISVETAMSRAVYSVSPDDPLSRVLEIMADVHVHHVPVVDVHRRVVGLISTTDVARWVQRTRHDRQLTDTVFGTFVDISEPSRQPRSGDLRG